MIDFEEYIRQDDASKKEKAQVWQTTRGISEMPWFVPTIRISKRK